MNATPGARLAHWPASAPALAWPGGSLSYGELRVRVAELAEGAASLGDPASPLAIVAQSRRNLVLGVLAALQLQRPALPLDPVRPDLAACLAGAAPGALLSDTGHDTPGWLEASAWEPGEARRASPLLLAPEAPALLVPTSGTSGAARIAMLPAAALDAHVAASAAVLPAFGCGDRWLVCLPMASIGGLAALWRTLSSGGCLALLERFDPAAAREIMAEGASHVSAVPAMLAPLAGTAHPAPRGLRCLLTGGGPLSAQAADCALTQGWPLWHGWGMTESASHVAAGPVDRDWHAGIAGRPLPGVQLAIGGDGRVAISGPMLMSGYVDGGEAGRGLEADGSLRTADLGEFLPDGRLRILGRADEVLVSGGVKIHPASLEDALARCEGAGEVAVAGRTDDRWGQLLVALYTGPATAAALDAFARSTLPSASRPRVFLRVAALPRNSMGKLLRGELAELAQKPALGGLLPGSG